MEMEGRIETLVMVRSGLTVHQRRIIEQKVFRCWVSDNGWELDGETEMGMERWRDGRREREKLD